MSLHMSEIPPIALINQHYFNKKSSDGFSPPKHKLADSKVQGVVLSCMTKLSPSGLFVSATAPDVVLGQIPGMNKDHQEKKRKGRPWKRRRED
jgi:hypothetical protein